MAWSPRSSNPSCRVPSVCLSAPVGNRDRRRDQPCVSFGPVTTAGPSATSSARQCATVIADAIVGTIPTRLRLTAALSALQRPRQAERSASHGALFPSAMFQRRCVHPALPASGSCRFDVCGRPGSLAEAGFWPRPNPRVCIRATSVRPCGFSPDAPCRDAIDSTLGVPVRSDAITVARSAGSPNL